MDENKPKAGRAQKRHPATEPGLLSGSLQVKRLCAAEIVAFGSRGEVEIGQVEIQSRLRRTGAGNLGLYGADNLVNIDFGLNGCLGGFFRKKRKAN